MRSGAQIFFTTGRKGVFIAWTLDYYLKVGFYIFMNLVLVLVARLYMLSTFGLLHFARFTPLGQTHLYCWGVSYTNAHSETTFCTPYLRVLLKHKSDVQWVQASGQKSEFFPQIVTVLTLSFYTQSLLPVVGILGRCSVPQRVSDFLSAQITTLLRSNQQAYYGSPTIEGTMLSVNLHCKYGWGPQPATVRAWVLS